MLILWDPVIESNLGTLLAGILTVGIDLEKKFQSDCGNYGNEVNYKYPNCKKMRNIEKSF